MTFLIVALSGLMAGFLLSVTRGEHRYQMLRRQVFEAKRLSKLKNEIGDIDNG